MIAFAIGTMVTMTAAARSLTSQNRFDCPPMASRNGLSGARDVSGPMLAQDVCEVHLSKGV
jgi:hypothetical protein